MPEDNALLLDTIFLILLKRNFLIIKKIKTYFSEFLSNFNTKRHNSGNPERMGACTVILWDCLTLFGALSPQSGEYYAPQRENNNNNVIASEKGGQHTNT